MTRLSMILSLILITNLYASQEREIEASGMTKMVSQQKVFHSAENSDYKNILLGEWCWVVKKYKTQATYLFWADDGEKDYWFRTFLDRLKKDLNSLLGIKCVDRMENRKGKSDYVKDSGINEAAKFVVFSTSKLSKVHGDWDELYDRLLAGKEDAYKSALHPPLGANTVLPLNFSKYPQSFQHEVESYPGSFLIPEDARAMTYFDLLIRIGRFVCDIPVGEKEFSEIQAQLLEARPDFKKALGM